MFHRSTWHAGVPSGKLTYPTRLKRSAAAALCTPKPTYSVRGPRRHHHHHPSAFTRQRTAPPGAFKPAGQARTPVTSHQYQSPQPGGQRSTGRRRPTDRPARERHPERAPERENEERGTSPEDTAGRARACRGLEPARRRPRGLTKPCGVATRVYTAKYSPIFLSPHPKVRPAGRGVG